MKKDKFIFAGFMTSLIVMVVAVFACAILGHIKAVNHTLMIITAISFLSAISFMQFQSN